MSTSKPVTQFSISAVSRLTGKSRSTIQRDLKAGKLSFNNGPNGAKLIDGAEILRVYPEAGDALAEEGSKPTNPQADPGHEREELRRRIESLEEERRRERGQLQAQIDHLQDALKLAQEGHNNATRLLQDHSGSTRSDEAIQALEKRLSNQHSLLDAKLAEVQGVARQQAVDDLKSLPWWSALRKLTFS